MKNIIKFYSLTDYEIVFISSIFFVIINLFFSFISGYYTVIIKKLSCFKTNQQL